ncbi:MAG: hypothetical protein Q8P60_08175 [Pseudorhodobacter sp.]|nr:hypothetical protein [Pseudorhodobacter sp.]
MSAAKQNLYVMNVNGHYFEINTQEIAVEKELLSECRFFDTEKALLEAVCSSTGCDLEEVEGSTLYITVRNSDLTMIDDRGFPHAIDCAVEDYIANFEL